MKKLSALITAAALLIIIWACSDLEHSNPFDPDWGSVTGLNNVELQIEKIDRIKVIWDSDYFNKDGYTFQLDRKLGDGEWQNKYKVFQKDIYFFTDSIAGINQTNTYRVRVGYDENLSEGVIDSVFNNFPSPTGVSLNRKDLNTIELRWSDNSNGEDGFIIDRYAGSTWDDSLAIIDENTESWTDSTVALNDSIKYRIWAYRKVTRSAAPESQWIDTTIPSPGNFTAVGSDITTIHISWTDNCAGEDGFKVEKKTGDGAWADYYTAPADSTSWIDHNADLNETIQYRIYAFKGADRSDYAVSNSVDNTFPAPTNLILNQMDLNSIRLDWTDNSFGEDGFIIDRKNSSGIWENGHQILSGNTEYWTDSPVDINDSLAYRIRAYKDVFSVLYYSGYSSANMNDINFPPPSNLIVTKISLSTIRLNWTDNSVGEDGFFIDKRVNSGDWIIALGAADADSTQWTDTTADVNLNIQYRIYAKAGTNYSNYLVSDIIDNTIPAPSNLSNNKIDINSIRINWTDNSSGEEGFVIDRSVNGTWTNSFATAGSNATQWTDDSAVINADLVYRVKTYYTTYYSNAVETGIISNTFPAPSNLTAQVTGMDITLNWTDNSIGEQGFIIDKKYDGGLWYDSYRTVTADSIPWTETVADTGKYYYRVKAYSGTDQSAATTVAEAWIEYFITFIKSFTKKIMKFDNMKIKQTDDEGYVILVGSKNDYPGTNGGMDFVLLKIDKLGNEVWEYNFGGSADDIPSDFEIINSEEFILAGYSESYSEDYNFWAVKCNSSGSQLWQENYGTVGMDAVHKILNLSTGGYFLLGQSITGAYLVKIDVSGNELWKKVYSSYQSFNCGIEIGTNSFIIGGQKGSDLGYLNIDNEGSINWEKTYGTTVVESFRSILKLPENNIALVGSQSDLPLIVKIDQSGNVLSDLTYNTDDPANSKLTISQAANDAQGNIYFVGELSTFYVTEAPISLTKIDSTGNKLWTKLYGDPSIIGKGYALETTSDGGVILVGHDESFNLIVIKTDGNGNVMGGK